MQVRIIAYLKDNCIAKNVRGIVFTEFLTFVENAHGYVMVDRIINESDLTVSGGAYTTVGNYPFEEMQELLMNTSKLSGKAPDYLLKEFGKHLWGVFVKGYPVFFKGIDDSFKFLSGIDDKIHPEVLKLYPDAELPRFDTIINGSQMELIYSSSRSMGDFAMGLIESCLQHFGETATVTKENLSQDGSKVRFIIDKGA